MNIKYFLIFLTILFINNQVFGQLFINEVQSSNDITIADNFLEYEDWIEIYNPTNSAVDLAGYFISDQILDPLKHQFKFGSPALTTVPANGYLVLWADDDEEQGANHLNFKLNSSGGETVYLTAPDQTTLIDTLQLPAIKTDESYIRQTDGTNNLYLSPTPTPDASNNTVTPYLPEPQINLPSGKYNSNQTISITADNGATIYYTTDGSTPSINSTIYNGAFAINTSKTVKTLAVKPGFIDSKMVYESYLIGATSNLPIVNVAIDPDYLFDDQIGMYVGGTNGAIGPCMDTLKNWWQDWQYEATVTLYEKNGSTGFNEACGIEISGGCGRNRDKKSFNIKFKSEYGKNNLNYKLFEDSDIDIFDGFKLRSGSSQSVTRRIPDVFIQKIVQDQFDLDLQYSRAVALYLNGAYWGLYHIRDRINAGYIQSYHTKVDKDNIDLIKFPNAGGAWRWWSVHEVMEGDDIDYYNMHNFAINNDLSIETNYKIVIDQLDVNHLIDYLVVNIYNNNGDWPENNIKIWRERTEKAKWRWLLYDTESMVWRGAHKNVDVLDQFLNETDPAERRNPPVTEFYRSLFNNESFKNEFIQRMNTYIHTVWDYGRTNTIFEDIKSEVSSEIEPDYVKWGGWDFDRWNTDVDKLDVYFRDRPAYALTMVKDVLSLGDSIVLNLNFDASTKGSILLHQNFFEVPFNYQATYFEDVEMYLHAIPKPGYRFVEWQEINDTNQKYQQNVYKKFGQNKTLTPVFEPALDLIINEIHYNPTGTNEDNEFIELYNPDSEAKSLWGYQFTNGIEFQFPENTFIQPSEYIIVAHNDSAYVNNGYQVFEWECGSLNNDGEALVFSNPANEVIDSVYFNDNTLWNQSADGLGFSLALLDNVSDNNLPTSWDEQASGSPFTPGRKNNFCEPIQNASTVVDVSCFGTNDGFIANNINGGTTPFNYSWNNGATTNVISNLIPGQYDLTVTDFYNCPYTQSFTVNEPTQLSISTTSTDETYYQANDGTGSANVAGGVSPYTYSWSNGANTQTVNNLSPGTHTVTVYDANGCPISDTVTIEAVDCSSLVGSVSSTDESYYQTDDGTASISVSGGASPYIYNWSNGSMGSSINNLTPGSYSIEVTDNIGCKISDNTTIAEISCNVLFADVSVNDESCQGEADGVLVINNISNGTAPYSILWPNGITTMVANNLSPGNFQLNITDSYGCSFQNNYTVGVDNIVQASFNINNVSSVNLNDGSIQVTPSGGAAPYSFNWSNTTNVQNLNNVGQGTYNVTISDSNGCSAFFDQLIIDNDCKASLIHQNNDTIISEVYRVAQFIESNGIIYSNSQVSFKAGDYIELKDNFDVKQGAELEIVIDGCN